MKVIFQKFKKEVFVTIAILTLIATSQLLTSIVNAEILDYLVKMDMNGFIRETILLVAIFALYLVFTYMLIRYQAFFEQKVVTWLRDRILLMNVFMRKIVKPIFLGLQAIWNKLEQKLLRLRLKSLGESSLLYFLR